MKFPGCTNESEILVILKNTFVRGNGKSVSECAHLGLQAASMTRYRLGVVAKIKEVAHKEILFAHCTIHLEHLAAKKLI